MYIDDGQTIQSFLKHDLIDEMIISKASLLLGRGIPLFASLNNPIDYIVMKTAKLNDYLVKIRSCKGVKHTVKQVHRGLCIKDLVAKTAITKRC